MCSARPDRRVSRARPSVPPPVLCAASRSPSRSGPKDTRSSLTGGPVGRCPRSTPPRGSCERAGTGELLEEHGREAIEHSLEPQVESVLEAVGIVWGASVDDDASEERVAAAVDQALDVGELGLHPLLLVQAGAPNGFLLG